MVAEAIFFVARLVVGGMFLVALVAKVRDLPSFHSAVRGFRVVPRHRERPVVFAVLGAEAAVVLLMVDRTAAAIGLVAAAVLLAAFAAGMARVVARGDRVPCGCFGASAAPISRAHIWRNALLATASVVGLVAGLTSGGDRLDGPVLVILSLFAAAVIAVLVLSDQMLTVPEPPRPAPRHPRPSVDSPSTGPTRKR